MARSASARRVRPVSSSDSRDPIVASPSLAVSTVTEAPLSASSAIVPRSPSVSSSGCGAITSTRLKRGSPVTASDPRSERTARPRRLRSAGTAAFALGSALLSGAGSCIAARVYGLATVLVGRVAESALATRAASSVREWMPSLR